MQPQDAQQDVLEFYQDKKNEWRWRRLAANGEVLADSAEGYVNHSDCFTTGLRVNGGNYTIRKLDS